MIPTFIMQDITIDIDLFYYIEEEYLTWHCPQFALYGVTPYEPMGKKLDDFALTTLERKVGQRTARFGSNERFLSTLVEHGHWAGEDLESSKPKPIEHYISTQPVLAKLVNLPTTNSSRHSYTISING